MDIEHYCADYTYVICKVCARRARPSLFMSACEFNNTASLVNTIIKFVKWFWEEMKLPWSDWSRQTTPTRNPLDKQCAPTNQPLRPCSWWAGLGANNMSHMTRHVTLTFDQWMLWQRSPLLKGLNRTRRWQLLRHIQTWGTQWLQWAILGQTCDNRRLNIALMKQSLQLNAREHEWTPLTEGGGA